MKKNKTLFIPGLSEQANNYRSFSNYMKVYDIDWNNIKYPRGKYNTIIGFSWGAIIACIYGMKHPIKTLILCDMTTGVETLKDVKADEVIFIIGEKGKWAIKDTRRVAKTLKCKWKMIIVPNGEHKIDKNYQKILFNTLDSLQE